MLQKIRKSVGMEEGATAVEYGIMVALIAAVIVLVVLVLGQQVREGFCQVSTSLGTVSGIQSEDGTCVPS